ncbi:aldehyde reductase [Diplodia corticola]|uniref:Aldehyde reductase n=1 Tax=Diplodia corticola TaxID=236234 RepID=A0A1J9R3P8_9PEZI|nr:aldehyde reductase [Diplodia corticola]OJD35201.1 aldehyde reductase [Diplodia corticola]
MVSFSIVSAAALVVAAFAATDGGQTPFKPHQGVAPPLLGFGTWNLKVSPDNTTEAVALAIQTGYRHIDAAAIYGNQVAVGKGIADGLERAGLQRDDIWVTSKLWNDHHGDQETVDAALSKTLEELGLEYLDLYLMHWPVGSSGDYDYVETWKSMEKLLPTKTRSIGVANFSPHQLKKLLRSSTVTPSVHQMELHPYLQQEEWVQFHQKHGIHVTAYSPLGNTNPTYRRSSQKKAPLLVENPELERIAEQRGCTVAQVALAWGIERGTSVIPKSSHESWIKENFEAVECGLIDADMDKIEKIGDKYLARFNNPSRSWGVDLFEGLDDA